MKIRPCYVPIDNVEVGMVLGASISIGEGCFVSFSLPAGHTLTPDNLNQLVAHRAEYVFVAAPDERSDEQVAIDAAVSARRVLRIFAGANLADPTMAKFFDQVLLYRSF